MNFKTTRNSQSNPISPLEGTYCLKAVSSETSRQKIFQSIRYIQEDTHQLHTLQIQTIINHPFIY